MTMRLPSHDVHAAAGAAFGDQAGWDVPLHYGNEEAEYHAAIETAVVFDLSHHAKIELAGPDARAFLGKPFRSEQLARKVREVLDGGPAGTPPA